MPAMDGSDVRVTYLWEDAGYRQSPSDSTPKVWGADAQLTTNEASRNATRIRLPASNTAVDIKSGTFDGSWAVEFGLTNPWWLRAIRGAPSVTDNGDGTYTYTYDGEPDPFRILEGYEELGDERLLVGCLATRAELNPDVENETARVTLEGFYATEENTSPASLTAQAGLNFDALDYSDARLDLNGTKQTIMQNASLALEWPNSQDIVGWDSHFPIDYATGNFDPQIDYTKIKVDNNPLTEIYGGSTSMQEDVQADDSVTIAMANDESGSATNQLTFSCSGSFPNTYGEDGAGDPTSLIQENINRMIQDCTITATNGKSSAP